MGKRPKCSNATSLTQQKEEKHNNENLAHPKLFERPSSKGLGVRMHWFFFCVTFIYSLCHGGSFLN